MKLDPRLHHYAQNITRNSLETVIELYKILDLDVVYRPQHDNTWAMVGQQQLRFAIQVIEVDEKPIEDIDVKKRVHIAFISDDPAALISKVETWAQEKNTRFRKGAWSEKELYFDLPDLFVNFVVEVLHTSIEE